MQYELIGEFGDVSVYKIKAEEKLDRVYTE